MSPEMITGIAIGGGVTTLALFTVLRAVWGMLAESLGGKMRDALADLVGPRHERLGDSEDEVPDRGKRRPKTGALQAIVGEAVERGNESLHAELAEVRGLALANGKATRANGAAIRVLVDAQASISERQAEHSERLDAASSSAVMLAEGG